MGHQSEDLRRQLKALRAALGMSQRALSARSGLTQAHISQIERGTIDPGLSSLIELARALGLEVALVPKRFIPAVEGIIAGASMPYSEVPRSTQATEVARFERLVKRQRQLHGGSTDLDRIEGNLRVLRNRPIRSAELAAVKGLYDLLKARPGSPGAASIVREVAGKLQSIGDRLAHQRDANEPRPAYVFDDEAEDA